MCGIAGLWAPRLDPHERLRLVTEMVERLRHRGPSGSAVWDGDGIALGIARLAIVARHAPASVLVNEDTTLHAVVNGEVYNHEPIRAALRARGHDVAAGPDTAVIPHLYEDLAAGFPSRLDGMFAVAVWDAPRRRLTLARDRAGEKPLFVALHSRGFAFASEPGALLALPWLARDPAPEAIVRYLAHGFFAGEDCAFAGIRQLPPAHVLEVTERESRATRYWRPWDALVGAAAADEAIAQAGLGASRGAGAPASDTPTAVREALAATVASRVPGEVPFGVFLSGGVDSGLVATLAARAVGHAFPTFCLRLAHRGYDESSLARIVAESIGAEHHVLTMDVADGEEALDTYARTMDQPLGDPSLLPTWALARLAARHVPVVLTGEGGDELFAGYPTYLGHRHAALAERIPGPVSDLVLALSRRFRPRHHHVTIAHLLERFLATRGAKPFERHLAWFGTARPAEALALLAPHLREAITTGAGRNGASERARLEEIGVLAHLESVRAQLARAGVIGDLGRVPLVAYQLLDFETYLSGDLLAKVDRCTMAHGVESRAPFLRHALVEFALGLPEDAKLRGASGKWALKQAAHGLLPDKVLRRRKQGFSPPFSAWARGPLAARVAALLSPARVVRAGVLDPEAVAVVLASHLENRADRGRTLWTLVSLQMWAEQWLLGGAVAGRLHAAGAERAPRVPRSVDLETHTPTLGPRT
jgi:asparagine synthase (glutamine-hydrolysing)